MPHSGIKLTRDSQRHVVTCACFFLSGFLALAYEICWIRKASLAFGATTYALSTVLAVFFGGLALGSFIFGKHCRQISNPLRAYAALEIGVGLLAILSPFAFTVADAIFGWVYASIRNEFIALLLVRFLLVSAIVLPPTFLMGGTLPLFCRQFVSDDQRISRSSGLLYGLNTLGAAMGCAVCGFFLIPRIGINVTIYLGGLLNVFIGLVIWRLWLPVRSVETQFAEGKESSDEPSPNSTEPWRIQIAFCLFFMTGFLALGYEIVWTRYLALLIFDSIYTYTLTLTVVLVGIVVGSFMAAPVLDRYERPALVFGSLQVATGVTVLAVLMVPAPWWRETLTETEFVGKTGAIFGVLFIPALLSGASFPTGIRMVVRRAASAGAGAGKMIAMNTFGGIFGSLVIGFLVLPWLGIQRTALVTTALSLVTGAIAVLALEKKLSSTMRCGFVVVSFVAWVAIPLTTETQVPKDFLGDNGELVDYREGLSTNLAVVRMDDELNLEIDRHWQGKNRKGHQIVAAHVPMLLHSDPKRVVVVGLGTGQTASRFLMYPSVERLDCVEVESECISIVRQHFDSEWMNDKRVNFIVEDGRNYLTHAREKYDIISIEVGQIFRPGVASFYTADFYRRAQHRLNRGGLISQFVPLNFFGVKEFQTVVNTFVETFPQSILWYNSSELLLVGTAGDEMKLDQQRLDLLTSSRVIHQDMDYTYWGGSAYRINRPEVFLAGFLLGPSGLEKLGKGVPVYRDDRPFLEYMTSGHRVEWVIAIAELLEERRQPVTSLFEERIDASTSATVDSIQQKYIANFIAEMFILRANNRLAEGQQTEAIEMLHEALRRNPDNLQANESIANLLRSAGKFDESLKYYRHILRLNPDDAVAHLDLVYSLSQLHQREEIIPLLRRALRLNPDYADAHYFLSHELRFSGENEDAEKHYREYLRLQEGAKASADLE